MIQLIQWTRVTAEQILDCDAPDRRAVHGDHVGRVNDRVVALCRRSGGRWQAFISGRRTGRWICLGSDHKNTAAAAKIEAQLSYGAQESAK